MILNNFDRTLSLSCRRDNIWREEKKRSTGVFILYDQYFKKFLRSIQQKNFMVRFFLITEWIFCSHIDTDRLMSCQKKEKKKKSIRVAIEINGPEWEKCEARVGET